MSARLSGDWSRSSRKRCTLLFVVLSQLAYYNCFTSCMSYQAISLMSRVFTNDPRDRGSIPGRVILKTQKMALDAVLLNTQSYKLKIKGKVQSREWSSPPPHTSVCGGGAINKRLKREPSGHPWLRLPTISWKLHKWTCNVVLFAKLYFMSSNLFITSWKQPKYLLHEKWRCSW